MDIIRPQLDQVRIGHDGKLPFALIDAIRRAYDYIAASSGIAAGSITIIQDTHANRAILFAPASFSLGSLYFETDRKTAYVNREVSSAPAWVYFGGVMSGLVAARPADLGVNDAGFLYTSTNSLDYRWSGTAWVTLGTVRGGGGLSNVGKLTKVSVAGTVAESSLTDNGTKVSGTEPLALDSGTAPANSQFTLKANALGVLSALCQAADNGVIGFDVEYLAGVYTAQDTKICLIQKNGGFLNIYGSTAGNVVGSAAVLTGRVQFNLANGNINALTGVYQVAGASGVSGNVTLLKLTGGGANGSLTFSGGIITAFTAPT